MSQVFLDATIIPEISFYLVFLQPLLSDDFKNGYDFVDYRIFSGLRRR